MSASGTMSYRPSEQSRSLSPDQSQSDATWAVTSRGPPKAVDQDVPELLHFLRSDAGVDPGLGDRLVVRDLQQVAVPKEIRSRIPRCTITACPGKRWAEVQVVPIPWKAGWERLTLEQHLLHALHGEASTCSRICCAPRCR